MENDVKNDMENDVENVMENDMENDGVRINKYIAQSGYCSRREADELIKKTLVIVNGRPAEAGMKVTDKDDIKINGKSINLPDKKTVLAYYKPMGVVCTAKDRHAEVTVIDALNYPKRLTYAGRLDKESEGLLIMTDDGDLIDAMMRGANRHEKEYLVRVDKPLTEEALNKMRNGIYIKELDETTRPCKIVKTQACVMKMVLTQGLNRQIRRMCRAVGYNVRFLKRTRVMNIRLGDLKAGEYRELSETELETLRADLDK